MKKKHKALLLISSLAILASCETQTAADNSPCTVSPLADGMGAEVICNGESVAIIANGNPGNPGNPCTIAKADDSDDLVVTCGDKTATLHNGTDGDDCSIQANADIDGYDVICGGVKAGEIKNGQNGASCSAEALKDGSGFEIKCDGKTVGTITNGIDGQSCEIDDKGTGIVLLQCGATTTELYKATCGSDAYDPEKKFCVDAELYDLCGGKVYDPSEALCSDEVVYSACDGQIYDSSKEFCDTRDGNIYHYVTIEPDGTTYFRQWMAENLRYATDNHDWCNNVAETNGGPFDCDKYGRLYTAEGATTACPEDWHLPSKDEWEALLAAIDGMDIYNPDNTAGKKLKALSGWADDGNGTDIHQFSALPAGYIDNETHYDGKTQTTYFWGTSGMPVEMSFMQLQSSSDAAIVETAEIGSKDTRAYAIRCIRND